MKAVRSAGFKKVLLKPEDFNPSLYDREAAWFALGDWGFPGDELRRLSAAMAAVGRSTVPRPDVIIALGDNFYPNGIESPEQWDMWRGFFPLAHPDVFGTVPWRCVMGNHDYLGYDPLEQMDFGFRSATLHGVDNGTADSKHRYDSLWQMRGDSSIALGFPSRSSAYSFSIPPGSSVESCFVPETADYYMPSYARGRDSDTRGSTLPVDVAAEGAFVPLGEGEHGGGQPPRCVVHFTAFDTNAAQFIVRKQYPNFLRDFPSQVAWLKRHLLANEEHHAADSTWRIFFCHHAFYTNGKGHENEARCLRFPQKYYPRVGDGASLEGLQLESQLVDSGVDAVFSGHEHVMQWVYPPKTEILHLCCGASVETGYYKGKHDECGPHRSDFPGRRHIDDLPDEYGFATGEVYRSKNGASTVLRCCFWGYRVDPKTLDEPHSVETVRPVLLKELLLQKPCAAKSTK